MSAMIVPNGWEVTPIEKLISKVMDFRGKTPLKIGMDWGGGTIQSLSANNVQMGKIDFSKDNHLGSEELYNQWMNKGATQQDDIVFTMEAPLGNVALIPNDEKYILSQRVVLLRPNLKIQSRYFFSYLMSDSFQNELWKYASGSTVKGIQYSKLKEIEILYPIEKLEQQKIATILSTLDRTIEATQKLIDKEKMVKKGLMADLLTHGIDEQGRIRSPQTHTYVDSPLGMIPEGWEVKAIVNISKTFAGGTPDRGTESYYTGHIPWVKSGEVNQNKIYDTEEKITEEALKNSNTKLIKKDTILVAMYGATAGQIAYLKIDACSNQAVLAIPINSDCNDFVFYALSYAMPKLLFQAQESGQPNLSKQLVDRTLLGMPLSYEQQKIAAILSAQDRKIETEEINLAKLQNLKKGLMGDLLSGKVRVKV